MYCFLFAERQCESRLREIQMVQRAVSPKHKREGHVELLHAGISIRLMFACFQVNLTRILPPLARVSEL